MELSLLRIIIEVASFAAFISIVAWAWSGRRVNDFERASRLPFDDDEPGPGRPR